ncbi:MAG: ROK family protein, partial [Spirochaetaceae bacterium]|nr:ROK family protein [Spirochaetaceae bacterium]
AGEFRSMLWDGGVGQFSSLVVSSDSSDFNSGSLEMVFHELARHIAFLVNILNLDEVYIGGLGKDLTERIVALVQECTENQWPYGIPRKYKIKADSLGDFSVAYGAAAMVVEDFFSLPNLSGSPKKISFIMEQLRC